MRNQILMFGVYFITIALFLFIATFASKTERMILHSQKIKKWVHELGFCDCGFAQVKTMQSYMKWYTDWLSRGHHAGMQYMENHLTIRNDPRLLHDNARTVLVTLHTYYPSQLQRGDAPQIAKYAYGRDYHKVLLKKHKQLLSQLVDVYGCTGRIFIDSAPVLERAWAYEAGLGWIGKNTNLISPKYGVHTFISGIVLDMPADCYDTPLQRSCKSCTRCLDACPTGALYAPHKINSNKCIAYLSIEHRGDFPSPTNLHNCVFGCDICIDACPFTKKQTHNEASFDPKPDMLSLNKNEWLKMDEQAYELLFNGTPVRRAKYKGIMRNLNSL